MRLCPISMMPSDNHATLRYEVCFKLISSPKIVFNMSKFRTNHQPSSIHISCFNIFDQDGWIFSMRLKWTTLWSTSLPDFEVPRYLTSVTGGGWVRWCQMVVDYMTTVVAATSSGEAKNSWIPGMAVRPRCFTQLIMRMRIFMIMTMLIMMIIIIFIVFYYHH